jgi:hypothetical protein
MPFRPTHIVLHHSATRDGSTYSWGAIRAWHVETLGWDDNGYHGGIERITDSAQRDSYAVLYGRPVTEMGAHCRGMNSKSLGFCFVGNYDEREPDQAMIEEAARRVLVPWMIQHGIGPQQIVGHRDYSSKTCPGARFDIERVREACRQILAEGVLGGAA